TAGTGASAAKGAGRQQTPAAHVRPRTVEPGTAPGLGTVAAGQEDHRITAQHSSGRRERRVPCLRKSNAYRRRHVACSTMRRWKRYSTAWPKKSPLVLVTATRSCCV